MKRLLVCGLLLGLGSVGCGGAVLEPGHRGLLFDPKAGGLRPEVLRPGYHNIGSCFLRTVCPRIDEFDISFTTKKEEVRASSSDGLVMDARVAVIFRPIESELYLLDTEIGPNYYEEVIGPEFRSASRGVFARHSYGDLQRHNEKIEDEIEADVRRRTKGKHVEIASITIETISYAPEISAAVQAKLVGEQEAARRKAMLEAEALRKKTEIQLKAEEERLQAEAAVRQKKDERVVVEEQAIIDKAKAEAEAAIRITRAKGQAEETRLLAKADAERKKAEATALTPLMVQMAAYEALSKLGASGSTIMLGDFTRVPAYMFPHFGFGGYNSAMGGGQGPR